jgi:hypothetical protein
MAFNLAAVHDVNTGIILTVLTIAFLKSRSSGFHSGLGLLTLVVFILSILPTPVHGRGIWGMAALLTAYIYLYKVWDNREVAALTLTAIIFMMGNIILGFKLRGIF